MADRCQDRCGTSEHWHQGIKAIGSPRSVETLGSSCARPLGPSATRHRYIKVSWTTSHQGSRASICPAAWGAWSPRDLGAMLAVAPRCRGAMPPGEPMRQEPMAYRHQGTWDIKLPKGSMHPGDLGATGMDHPGHRGPGPCHHLGTMARHEPIRFGNLVPLVQHGGWNHVAEVAMPTRHHG